MGRRAVLLAVLATALAWPASAFAATGRLDNGTMVYTADAGELNNVVFTVGGDEFNPTFRVEDAPAVAIAAEIPCFNPGQSNVMECPQNGGGTGQVVLFQASLGDDNDSIRLQTGLVPTSIGAGGGADVMAGGPAPDFLRGGQGADIIDGNEGNDQLVGDDPNTPGGGDDFLKGGLGNDTYDGQDGNDTFANETVGDGADVFTGGNGTDTVTFVDRSAPLEITLDGQANDGQAGEGDNVQTDVENAVGGRAADQITGNDAPNGLDGGAGNDVVTGAGGDDAVVGGAGDDSGSGGDGNDRVAGGDGNDLLNGGPGSDEVVGDGGGDVLDGGPGGDVMLGGDGNDLGTYATRTQPLTITLDGNANDGEAGEADNLQTDVENVDAGAGADTIVGSNADNALSGGGGEDYADGGAGSDRLVGGDAGDVLRTRGGSGPAAIECGPGRDFVVAKQGDTAASDCDRVDRGVNQRPVVRDSALVTPGTGTLQMSPTGIVRRVPLQDRVVLPLRSIVDSVAGTVKITSAASTRKRQTMALEDGVFNITQTAGRLPITQFALRGGDFSACPAVSRRGAARAAQKPKTVRMLWAKGKGKFRTRGRYAAATVRGTRWQTVDRCDGTLIRVTEGSVTVRDLVAKRTVVVRRGRSYLASASR